jgi:hypothetical protein
MKSSHALAGMLLGAALLFSAVAVGATFSAAPTSGVAPLPVSFSSPYATAGDDSGWMMDINFGDASSGKMLPPAVPPCSKSPSGIVNCSSGGELWRGAHTYTSAGTYTVTLVRGGLPLCGACSAPVLGSMTITVTSGQ